MIKNYILINTNNQRDLENVLFDLANLYADTAYVHGIELYRRKNQTDSFLIQFSSNPDLDRFSYFINYIEYPINLPDFKSKVRGFYKTKDITGISKLKTGEWLMFFINPKDKDADNVYIVNEAHKNFIYDFGGLLKPLDIVIEKFKMHSISLTDYHHILDIHPAKNKLKNENPNSYIWQNLKDLFAIVACLVFTILGFITYNEESKHIAILTVLFFGFGFVLLLWNYLKKKTK